MQLRYNVRLDPSPGQIAALSRAFGCARVVFNDGLRLRQETRAAGLPYLSDGELSKRVITEAKKTPERAWLAEVSAVVLQQAAADLNTAYRNWFGSLSGKRRGRKVGPPRFRSRKDNRQAIRFTKNARFAVIEGRRLRLPKIGDVAVRWSRERPSEPSSVAVIRDAAGRYFASFVVQVRDEPLPPVEDEAGIDVGLEHFAVLSNGTKVTSPTFLRRVHRKLRRLHKDLSRKRKGSNNRRKAVVKVARAHVKVADTRRDWQHKLSTTIIRENQAVYVEDLCVAGLGRTRLARSGVRRGLVAVRRDAGVQGGPVRPDVREGRPVLPVVAGLFCLRDEGWAETAVGQAVDVSGVRDGPRPGRERGEEHQDRGTQGRRRTGRDHKRPWSAGKTGTCAGTARRSGNPPEAHAHSGVADGNFRPSRRRGCQYTCFTRNRYNHDQCDVPASTPTPSTPPSSPPSPASTATTSNSSPPPSPPPSAATATPAPNPPKRSTTNRSCRPAPPFARSFSTSRRSSSWVRISNARPSSKPSSKKWRSPDPTGSYRSSGSPDPTLQGTPPT